MLIDAIFKYKTDHCRELTSGEVKLAQSVYGDRLDFNPVRIHRGSLAVKFLNFAAAAPSNNVYFDRDTWSPDFSRDSLKRRANFVHELMHVDQSQHGRSMVAAFIGNMIIYRGHYVQAYELPTDGRPFEHYNVEQQARTVQNAYEYQEVLKRNDLTPELRSAYRRCYYDMVSRLPEHFHFDRS